jgi:hypothetical protein
MSDSDTVAAMVALEHALSADQLLWSTHCLAPGSSDHRRERDLAVLEAVEGGLSVEFVADRLGVRIGDVERMAEAARDVTSE